MNRLVALALTFGVGASVIGCSASGTPTAPLSSTISTTENRPLVDVAKVWATHPLPPCKDYLGTDRAVPPGISVPDYDSVAKELAGVKSTGSESWVRTKLGWLDRALAETRAGIIDANAPGDDTELRGFQRYVTHVKTELQAGRDITDSDADGDYPEGCR